MCAFACKLNTVYAAEASTTHGQPLLSVDGNCASIYFVYFVLGCTARPVPTQGHTLWQPAVVG